MADVDAFLAGCARPSHEPDWDRLPHVVNEAGRFTEVGVDTARGSARAEVLASVQAAARARRAQLDALPDDAQVPNPFGRMGPLERVLRMRIFDLWVHEQDIREALDLPGGLNSRAAVVTYQQIAKGLLAVWSDCGALTGSVLHVEVIGPGVRGEVWIRRAPDGRSAPVAAQPEPTLAVTISWPDLVDAACGRAPGDRIRARAHVVGDPDLARRLFDEIVMTP